MLENLKTNAPEDDPEGAFMDQETLESIIADDSASRQKGKSCFWPYFCILYFEISINEPSILIEADLGVGSSRGAISNRASDKTDMKEEPVQNLDPISPSPIPNLSGLGTPKTPEDDCSAPNASNTKSEPVCEDKIPLSIEEQKENLLNFVRALSQAVARGHLTQNHVVSKGSRSRR